LRGERRGRGEERGRGEKRGFHGRHYNPHRPERNELGLARRKPL
jgi:hypothetical protein